MEVPRHWRLKKQRYALVGEVCLNCRTHLFPPREVCPNCGSGLKLNNEYQEQQALPVSQRAEVAA